MRHLAYDSDADVWVISFRYPDGSLGYTQAESRCEAVRAGFSAVRMLRKIYTGRRNRRRGIRLH